jgi:FHS family L-fucose permease-like MFS transporter
MSSSASTGPTYNAAVSNSGQNYTPALIVLTSLFFMWGLITSLNDVLIPHLKGIFTLSYFQAMLVQFAFFGAYFVMSFPSGYLVEKLGYRAGIVIGLATAGVACLGFYPAASLHSYPLFLVALFVLASGITLLQVAANPYVAVLGKPETSSARLNLTQAFNSLGTFIGPYIGGTLILTTVAVGATDVASEIRTVQGPYVGLAVVLFLIAVVFTQFRLPVVPGTTDATAAADTRPAHSVWHYSHLVLGAIAIFCYVGAEVTIGSFMVNFISQPDIGGLSIDVAAKYYLPIYWGGAMVGRFIGAIVLRVIRPGTVLAFNALVIIALLTVAVAFSGHVAMWSVLAIGLFNSIMFPTIFTLAIAKLGRHTGEGSGVLCMAIVGGALVPLLQGAIADHLGVLLSFFVPAICYAYIVYYGAKGHVVRDVA